MITAAFAVEGIAGWMIITFAVSVAFSLVLVVSVQDIEGRRLLQQMALRIPQRTLRWKKSCN